MKEAIKIIKTLQDNKHYALLVGGCVRDKFMGLEPKDYDIVTTATPEQVKNIFTDTIPVGESFGVTIVNKDYEVACFRADVHNPNNFSVELLDPNKHTLEELIEKDSMRRDLTMNAIYLDPITGIYYDPQLGRHDIQYGAIKFVGEVHKRIKEDPVRIIRYFRFIFKHNLPPMREDLQTIYNNRELLLNVSKERIFSELTKLLLNINSWNKDYFDDLFIMLSPVFPELYEYSTTVQSRTHHPEGNVLVHTFNALKQLRVKTPVTVWATLLHDVGKIRDTKIIDGKITAHGHDATGAVMTEEILRGLKCANKFIDEVTYIVANHMRIKWAANMRRGKVIRLIKNKYYENLLEVSCADSMGATGKLDWYHWIKEFAKSDKCPKGPIIKPLVTGKDLIELGYTPGPGFKDLLEEALTRQLEHPEMTKNLILLDLSL